ncbi:hypothetical protein [Brucella pseudogrignonensis]|uniref:hypothetical protein n=1 Tax=Brucella pseudogrignonensis TaxID=419475 RepID=UPI001F1BCCEA|nr:hypothetical protein [Brucella pseudogrignonensis]
MNFFCVVFFWRGATVLSHPFLFDRADLFFALMIGMALSAEIKNGSPVGLIVFASLSTLLFPFAKLVWDELRDLAFGNNVIFYERDHAVHAQMVRQRMPLGVCDLRCTDRDPVFVVPHPPAFSQCG